MNSNHVRTVLTSLRLKGYVVDDLLLYDRTRFSGSLCLFDSGRPAPGLYYSVLIPYNTGLHNFVRYVKVVTDGDFQYYIMYCKEDDMNYFQDPYMRIVESENYHEK